jgi:hypothetical protein
MRLPNRHIQSVYLIIFSLFLVAFLALSPDSFAQATGTIYPETATPVLSLASGNYSSARTVTITDATSGAVIYYTINGTYPSSSSAKYSGPITVSTTETIKAVAIAAGDTTSSLASATYTFYPKTGTPVLSLVSGNYSSAQTVTITDATSGAIIYYTTNGSTPTSSSAKYTGPITISTTETIHAVALAIGHTTSSLASATYTIATVLPKPTFSVPPGTYTSTQTVAITDTNSQATIYFTTTGTPPTTTSAIYTSPITVSSTETIMAMAAAKGYTNSAVASAAYTINQAAKQVDLSWDEPASSPAPVAGYNIYRATGSSSVFQLLNSSAVTSTTYVDRTAQSGTTYSYYVKSVDAAGMQSVPSNQSSVTIP